MTSRNGSFVNPNFAYTYYTRGILPGLFRQQEGITHSSYGGSLIHMLPQDKKSKTLQESLVSDLVIFKHSFSFESCVVNK